MSKVRVKSGIKNAESLAAFASERSDAHRIEQAETKYEKQAKRYVSFAEAVINLDPANAKAERRDIWFSDTLSKFRVHQEKAKLRSPLIVLEKEVVNDQDVFLVARIQTHNSEVSASDDANDVLDLSNMVQRTGYKVQFFGAVLILPRTSRFDVGKERDKPTPIGTTIDGMRMMGREDISLQELWLDQVQFSDTSPDEAEAQTAALLSSRANTVAAISVALSNPELNSLSGIKLPKIVTNLASV